MKSLTERMKARQERMMVIFEEALNDASTLEQEVIKTQAVNDALRKTLQRIDTVIHCIICTTCYNSIKTEIDLVAETLRTTGGEKTVVMGRNHAEDPELSDEVLREVEELSSMPFDTQYVSDNEEHPPSPNEKPLVSRSPAPSAKSILEKMFGATQSSEDRVLAHDTPACSPCKPLVPVRVIPETMAVNERTPIKYRPYENMTRTPEFSAAMESPPIPATMQVASTAKLMGSRHNLAGSQLLSPVHHRTSIETSPLAVKRKRKATPSPGKRKQGTPGKSRQLKKSHQVETEMTRDGMKKLTQSKLGFQVVPKENPDHEFKAPIVEFQDDLTFKEEAPHVPLQELDNSPDLDETNLSASALRKLAVDLSPGAHLESTYDRIPFRSPSLGKSKEARRGLPGFACPGCENLYNDAENSEERQAMLNRCSRHRIVKPEPPATPKGFWNPIVTQTSRYRN